MQSDLLILYLTIGLLFIQLLWIITEPRPLKKRFTKPIIITYLLETIIVLLQIISALLYPWPATPIDTWIVGLGISLYTGGMILAIWAKQTMKQNWGEPGRQRDYTHYKRELVTSGPFRFSRNPIYVGLILLFFGYSIALRSWFIFLRFPLLWYFYKSIKKEEKLLKRKYKDSYLTYQTRVPRFLLI